MEIPESTEEQTDANVDSNITSEEIEVNESPEITEEQTDSTPKPAKETKEARHKRLKSLLRKKIQDWKPKTQWNTVSNPSNLKYHRRVSYLDGEVPLIIPPTLHKSTIDFIILTLVCILFSFVFIYLFFFFH